MQPTKNIGYLLQHLAFTMARQNDQMLQERLGVGFSQFKLLIVLQHSPRTQQREIADMLGQTEASISRQIKLMHRQGLLQTQINPANRREHLTTLTTKGLRITEEAMNILNSFHAPVFARLGEKHRLKLLEILETMHGGVCEPGKSNVCFRMLNKEEDF